MSRQYRSFAVTALAAAVLVAGCSGGGGSRQAPRKWIADHYRYTAGGYLDPKDRPSAVAREITRKRKAKDRVNSGDMVFLRYKDDIVAVSPRGGGSKIEIADYDTGYRRWHHHISSYWPNPSRTGGDFRGGGSGSGK